MQAEKDLIEENLQLREQLEEYKDLVEGIRTGGVDALAISKNGKADIFSLESADFVYRVLVENFAEGALNVSDKGLIIYANPAFEKLLACNNSSIVGTDLSELIDPHFKRNFDKLFREAFSGTSKGEINIVYKERKIPVLISLSSLYPRFHGIGILITDLSEKKQQEEVLSNYKRKLSQQEEELLQAEILRKSTERFRIMGNTVPQKVWTADSAGKLDYFNHKWIEYTGLTENQLLKAGWTHILLEDDRAKTEGAWARSIKTSEKFEVEHRLKRADGSYRWHFSQAVMQQDKGEEKQLWVGTTTDIQEQKAFTEELEDRVNQAVEFLQTIFDSSEELITSFDTNFNFTSINKVAAKYTQIDPRDFVGKNLLDVFPHLHNSKYLKTLRKVLKGETIFKQEVVKILGENRIFETYYKPLVINNVVQGIIIVATDNTALINMTEKLTSAKIQLEEQFMNIEKKNHELQMANNELLSFTYVASHDLKEPLRKIRVFSNMILEREQNQFSPESRGYFARIISAIRHMQNLIEALLNYSKINSNTDEFVEANLEEILSDVKTSLEYLLEEKKGKIESDTLPPARVIPFQIHQLFTNLVSNSLKYCRKDQDLLIHIRCRVVNREEINLEGPIEGKNYLHISFRDNGIGFDQAYQFKIFELFQRLHSKEDYDGTGVGLAICNKIIQNHNGFIDAAGEPGVGSTFNVYLPAE